MKKILAGLGILSLVLGVALPVLAADITEGVTATVTPKLIALTVSDGGVSYGVLNLSVSTESPTTQDTVTLVDTQVIKNEGNVSATFDVMSSDATGGTPWSLVDEASIATDAFGHHYKIDAGAFTDFPSDNSYAADVVTLDKKGEVNDDASLDLKIFMPTGSTDVSTQKSITVTVRVHE